MGTVTSYLRDEGKSDVHDPEQEPMEQEIHTPDFISGIRALSMGEVLHFLAWTDMPGSKYSGGDIDRRVSGRFIMTRTTARQLHRDLGKLLNAGN